MLDSFAKISEQHFHIITKTTMMPAFDEPTVETFEAVFTSLDNCKEAIQESIKEDSELFKVEFTEDYVSGYYARYKAKEVNIELDFTITIIKEIR